MASRVFRVTWRNWAGAVILPLSGIAFLAALGIGRPGPARAKYFWEALLIGSAIFVWFKCGQRFWRTRLQVSQDGIICQDEKTRIDIRWTDVIAAWRTTEARRRFLHIGTADQVVTIGLSLFSRDLAPTLESLLPPSSLAENSCTKLPQHQRWCTKRKEIVQNTATVLRVNLTQIKVVGWLSLILFPPFTVLVVMFPRGPVVWFAVIPGILSAGGLSILLTSGPIEFNSDCAIRITPSGRYTIRWDAVEMVEADSQGQTIVLSGGDKCLPLPGPALWSGKQKADVIEFFLAQIGERCIPIRETSKALRMRRRNTKVFKAES